MSTQHVVIQAPGAALRMKVAECRMKDPKCGSSRGLAAKVAQELHEGKTSDEIGAELDKPNPAFTGPF